MDDNKPRSYTRIELPARAPVIDVMACCGSNGELVWLNLYQERGAFLSLDQVHELTRALIEQAEITRQYRETKCSLPS